MSQIVLANLTDLPLQGPSATITSGGTFSTTGPGYYWVNRTSGATLTVQLLAAPAQNQLVAVKDIKGDAGSWAINITDPNGKLIDGQSQLTLNTPFAGAALIWNGASWSQIA